MIWQAPAFRLAADFAPGGPATNFLGTLRDPATHECARDGNGVPSTPVTLISGPVPGSGVIPEHWPSQVTSSSGGARVARLARV